MLGLSKRRVFVSYNHSDQGWKNAFVAEFSLVAGIFADGSLDDRVDSTQPDYVHRRIREEYITGTSVTVVLCGQDTWKRRYVDWEIHSTLLKRHGLLGIVIPGTQPVALNTYTIPDRLNDNLPGYASLYHWPSSPSQLASWLEDAAARANHMEPSNTRVQMSYNRP